MKKIKILAIVCALAMATNVHAALQARPGVTAKNYINGNSGYKLVRQMEEAGGVMGLNAILNIDDATGICEEISESNNVDIHMIKNTEWGAAAMLSASEYGAGTNNVKSDYNSTTKSYGVTASTTGNMTGVFGMNRGAISYEMVSAAITSKTSVNNGQYFLMKAASRYVDNYAEGTDSSDFSRYIPGDATYELMSFSSSPGRFVSNQYPVFCRPDLFVASTTSNGSWGAGYGTRACMWVGDGI